MARRDFGQYCGLARALELVGERWGLLIVRELLGRPCRFTDLLDSLPGIPTNVLSARLKDFEDTHLVERRIAPAPQRGVVYALTEAGERLEPAVLALARWGSAHLGARQPGEIVPASTLALTLRATFNPEAARGLNATWEIRTAGITLHAVIADSALSTGVGPAPGEPDLVITVPADEVPTFREILQAAKDGQAELTGQQTLLAAFLRSFTPAGTVPARSS